MLNRDTSGAYFLLLAIGATVLNCDEVFVDHHANFYSNEFGHHCLCLTSCIVRDKFNFGLFGIEADTATWTLLAGTICGQRNKSRVVVLYGFAWRLVVPKWW